MYSNEAVLVGRFKWDFKQSPWPNTLRTMCCSIPPRTTERMDMWQGDSALLWEYVRLLTFPRLLGCWNRCVFFQGTPYKSLYKILRTLLISHLPFPRKKCFKQDKDSPCAQVLRFAWNVMIFLLVSFPRKNISRRQSVDENSRWNADNGVLQLSTMYLGVRNSALGCKWGNWHHSSIYLSILNDLFVGNLQDDIFDLFCSGNNLQVKTFQKI